MPSVSPPPTPLNEEALLDQIFQATELISRQQYQDAQELLQGVIEQDPAGSYGTMAAQTLETIPGDHPKPKAGTVAQSIPHPAEHPATNPPKSQDAKAHTLVSLPQSGILSRWSNLSLRYKLTALLVAGASVPILVLTQVMVQLTQGIASEKLEESLQQAYVSLEVEYVSWTQGETATQAQTFVGLVEALEADPRDLEGIARQRIDTFTRQSLAAGENGFIELVKNVRLLTDPRGQVVEQVLVAFEDNQDRYHEPILNPDGGADTDGYPIEEINLPLGADLSTIPIVAAALASGETLTGMELLGGADLAKLGLTEQAAIPLSGSSPIGAETEDGQMGLVAITVQPILSGEEPVGTAIVAALLNRNSAMVDVVRYNYEAPLVAIFAQDHMVATTLPDPSGQRRAVGTFAPTSLSQNLLDPDSDTSELSATVNLLGTNYLVQASTLRNHQGDPVGMLMVGRPERDLISILRQQQAVGYSIGGGILVLAALVAVPLAGAFSRPIRKLATFAQRLGDGFFDQRLEDPLSQDELGILATEMNAMAGQIQSSMLTLQQQEEEQRRGREHLQQDVMTLLMEIEGARDGDLTRRAPVSSGEVGFVGDAFNVTLDNLSQLVASVRATSDRVNSLAHHSEAVVTRLAEGSQAQASQLQHSRQLSLESSDAIQQISGTASEAAAIAQQSAQAAQSGTQAMYNTVTLYEQLRSAVGKTSKRVKHLVGSSQEINTVVAIIQEISNRTSLLAFNAVLEADRAGAQGQGFRQIADEIVELSRLIRTEFSQIQRLTHRIQEDTAEVAQAMEDSIGAVAEGTQLVQQTAGILTDLAHLAEQIDTYQQTIAEQTEAHQFRSAQVATTIDHVSRIASRTSQQSQDVVNALRELLAEVHQLQASVLRFRLRSEDPLGPLSSPNGAVVEGSDPESGTHQDPYFQEEQA
ncbi:MAG: HAMP domain-containing protein [Synechococcaceae cyanobacterium SM2_3_2]|nr:HAMP domain-containing protein [Synechococcaceae cyanobacterium SM2_3_2]